MSNYYLRPLLATKMAEQLLNPGVLDEALRSGLFLSGQRRTGKTTFILQDLKPALENAGALVIYVDLWSDPQASPLVLLLSAVQSTLKSLEHPVGGLLDRLKRLKAAEAQFMGFKFGFKIESVGTDAGPTLADALASVVKTTGTDLVVIVDEVQHAISTEEGTKMLLAMKAARDAINLNPEMPGHFVFIGTGSHRAQVAEMIARRNQAFAGAASVDYPVLGKDFVEFLLDRLRTDMETKQDVRPLPSLSCATQAFETLGNRPEEFLRAIRQLLSREPDMKTDEVFGVIAATLRSSAADLELSKVENLGGLALAIFARIANSDGEAKGVFSNEASNEYSQAIGREVRNDEIQTAIGGLLDANIIMRRGHGLYAVTDPFVQEVWRERQRLLNAL